jgi:branched-chain amino acid transport system ATP-binding protein
VTALLEAKQLSAGYYGHPVVRDLDLEVQPGEVVALLGANGAGKTTTLMSLAGHLPALAGQVRIGGDPTTAPLHIRARGGMAYVPEGRSVFMSLTTAENLRVANCDEHHAVGLFPELEPLMGRLAGQLSGGEQQMLTLGRALARRPRLLLADELSLGLGPLVVKRLLQAVRRAADDEGIGALIVEQHVNQALRYVDRVYVLRRGCVIASGTVEETRHRLRDAYIS